MKFRFSCWRTRLSSRQSDLSFPGGIPLTNEDGEVVGAIGVSGGTVKEDQAVAEDGAEAAANLLERRAA
jgi:uncharacterized protein GlcG (DUF336 family)